MCACGRGAVVDKGDVRFELVGAYPLRGADIVVRVACDLPRGCRVETVRAWRLGRCVRRARAVAFPRVAEADGASAACVACEDGSRDAACDESRVMLSACVPAGVAAVLFSVVVADPAGDSRLRRHCLVRRRAYAPTLQRWIVARTNAPDDPRHDAWMRARKAGESELAAQRAQAPRDGDPLVSIVTPAFRTPERFLRAMVNSVLAQTYAKLELVLVNASGECPEVDRVLASYDDPRIRVIAVENAGIAANTNVGIAAARGDYIAFVDHDDFIEPDALWHYVEAIRANPQIDLLFCDEDLYGDVDGQQRYYGVRFKPGWNPDLLFTHDYVCHMLAVSRRVIELTQRSADDVTGAQDYDLTFRAAEVARAICHVPRVLYHWRVHELSTAVNRDSKPYAQEAGRLAVQHHFDRVGIAARVEDGAFRFSYRVRYELLDPLPRVSLVVAASSDTRSLARTLVSLATLDWPAERLEVVVACDEVSEPSVRPCVERAGEGGLHGAVAVVSLVSSGQAGPAALASGLAGARLAALLNKGARAAHGDLVVLLDDRCEAIASDMLAELAGPLVRPSVACVAPELVAPDGLVRCCGLFARGDGSFGMAEHGLSRYDDGYMTMLLHARDCLALPARGLAMRRADLIELGGLDPDFGPAAAQELCLRIVSSGRRCVVQPYAPLRVWTPEPAVRDGLAASGAARGEAARTLSPEQERLARAWPLSPSGDALFDPWLDVKSDLFKARHGDAGARDDALMSYDGRLYRGPETT